MFSSGAVGVLILILLLIIVMKAISMAYYLEDEETVIATTCEEPIRTVGVLRREADNGQGYVIDPVDQRKIWLNSNDDLYEDAGGKVWRLI